MNRTEKEQMVQELRDRFSRAKLAVLAEYAGLQVEVLQEIRRKLKGAGGEFKVIKNTLAKRAIPGTPMDGIGSHLEGPVAVIIGYDDPVVATKLIKEFSDREEKLKIKVGVLEGQLLDQKALASIALLPSREVLQARLVQQVSAPIAHLVGGLHDVVRRIVSVLDAVKRKKAGASA